MTPSATTMPRASAAPKSRFCPHRSLGAGALALFIAGCGGGGGSSVDSSASVPPPPAPATYTIAGTIGGLSAPGLVLRNNGGDDLAVAAHATSFQFPAPVAAGGGYAVTVQTQPQGLTCSVNRGAGTQVNAPVADIGVVCSPITHTIAGTVAGLSAGGLVLQNNGGDDLVIPANTAGFQFATPVASGGGYSVTVLSQPTGLTCTVNSGSGAPINADISNVQVVCSTSALSIGGTVAGLTVGGLVLQNNGADNLAIPANAADFVFPTPVAYGSAYNVTVFAQPSSHTCMVSSASGAATTTVSNVSIVCVPIATYTVTPSAGANGSISPNTPQLVNSGGSLNFTATANAGYAVNQWLVDGSLVQIGGSVYQLTNITANHTVSVSFNQTTLTPSVSSLALSVNDTAVNAALTGNARQITITNSGSVAASNVAVTSSGLPAGTSITSNTCSGTLTPGSSCTVTITPGTNATSGCTTGAAPTADTLTVSADNAASTGIGVVVLGYGCIYQGGYLFAVDDTTINSASIGGKVLEGADQSPSVQWSSGSATNVAIHGIDETSTASSASPTSPAYPVGAPPAQACNGALDGACNSANIIAYHDFEGVSRSDYRAGECSATINGYSDWYLPAVCELSHDSGIGCGGPSSPTTQNVSSSLVDSGIVPLTGPYWSSTEASIGPSMMALSANIDTGFTTSLPKNSWLTARCARALVP